MPSVDSEVVVTTRMSPCRQNSIAAWIMRLSPGWQEIVMAVPAALGGRIDRPHVRPHQTGARLRFMDRRDAEIAQSLHDVGIGRVNLSNNCWFHKSLTLLCASNRLILQTYVQFDKDSLTAG